MWSRVWRRLEALFFPEAVADGLVEAAPAVSVRTSTTPDSPP